MPFEISTEDKLEYVFNPIQSKKLSFKVRASNDAHIALTSGPAESDPMVEIFIGGWKNTKSVIRRNRTKPDVTENETPDVLNAGEFRGFWIRWTDNVITVGKEDEAAAFLSYDMEDDFPIAYYGICTGWGANGSWVIDDAPISGNSTAVWVAASNGEIPADAIVGGNDGEEIYIGRAQHEGAIIPGKVVKSHGVCYIPWGGVENPKPEYEVLCGANGLFVPGTGSDIPAQALPAGETEDGEPLFIGRATHEGTVTIGKVQPSHGVCYIPYAGEELSYAVYEIYIVN